MNTPQHILDEESSDRIITLYTLLKDRKKLDEERLLRCTENFRSQVALQMKKEHWTRKSLSDVTGISLNRLSEVLSLSFTSKRPNLTLKTLSKIASALDCSLDVRLSTFKRQLEVPTEALLSFKEEMMNL